AAHQAVGELPGLDGEGRRVAGHLIAGFIPEDHLENALARLVGPAPDEGDEMGREGDGRRRVGRQREVHPGEVDAGRPTRRGLAHVEVFDEQRRDNVHTRTLGHPTMTTSTLSRSAMISTGNALAAQAGLWALAEGGSAIDAAVAADAVLGVT